MFNPNLPTDLHAKITPVLQQLEQRRSVIFKHYAEQFAVIAGLVILFGSIAIYKQSPPLAIAGLAGVIAFYWLTPDIDDDWQEEYKSLVIAEIIRHFCGETAIYSPTLGISPDIFNQSQLFSHQPDRYFGEDLVQAKINKTTFAFSEVNAERKTEFTTTNHGNVQVVHTNWTTIFCGTLFIADFNKQFAGSTVVKQANFWRFLNYGNIRLENPDFMKEFSVRSTDETEARYILTPALMESILQLNKNFGGRIALSFVDSSVVIAMPEEHNFFEISVHRPLLQQKSWERDAQFVQQLLGIIEILNLNTRIWTKE